MPTSQRKVTRSKGSLKLVTLHLVTISPDCQVLLSQVRSGSSSCSRGREVSPKFRSVKGPMNAQEDD